MIMPASANTSGNHMDSDKNDFYVLRSCIIYLQRHLHRYPCFDTETLKLVCWILGNKMDQIGNFVLKNVKGNRKSNFEEELSECDLDPDDYARVISNGIRKGRPFNHKKLGWFVAQVMEKKFTRIKYRGKSEIEKNVMSLQKMLGLSDGEADLYSFLFMANTYSAAEDFFLSHLECHKFAGQKYLANILGFSRNEFHNVIYGTLKRIGLYEVNQWGIDLDNDFYGLIQSPSNQIITKNFYNKVPKGRVPLESYFIDREQTTHILDLLKTRPQTANHILLYGPPGTGKTSYAYSLLDKLNNPAYEIVRGEENTAKNRRTAIVACLNMTDFDRGSTILVDEADNLLNTQGSWFMRGETQDKGWLNELLEKPGTRMIWITNRISGIEESVLRRFAFSLHFKAFNRRQRTQLWVNIIKQNKCKRFFAHEDIERYAKKHKLNAGVIDLAVKKALEKKSPSKTKFHQTVETALRAHKTLINNGEKPPNKDQIEKAYSLAGLNVEGDIQAMLSQLEAFDNYLRNENQSKIRNMNLLFYGPPGTGKSELARYIADRIDREVICKRISDLQSMWVGEGEKNIKRAFAEAESEDAILIIDEADSLLYNRDSAVRSWEISFTNEFLTQMEHFRGFLICTTNRMKDLDQASLRRFNHKVGFDFLTPEGNIIFYKLFLEALTDASLDQITQREIKQTKNLAPGDFKVVRDRYSFYPKDDINHGILIEALAREAAIKAHHNQKSQIGF